MRARGTAISTVPTVPVTVAWRDIARLGGRRAVSRAGFAIAAPMPAFVPSSSQCGGQLLLNQLFDESDLGFPPRSGRTKLPQETASSRPKASCYQSSWRDLRRDNAGPGWLNEPEITPPSNSNHFPDGTAV